jgi:hypothetical protein
MQLLSLMMTLKDRRHLIRIQQHVTKGLISNVVQTRAALMLLRSHSIYELFLHQSTLSSGVGSWTLDPESLFP